MTRRQLLSFLSGLGLAGASAASKAASTPTRADRVELSAAEWKKRLSPEAFHVLREEGTERPRSSPLNGEKRAGLYHCAGCDLALFSSRTKYESGTGWPSFFDPLPDAIGTRTDFKAIFPRTEYHCTLRRPPRPRLQRRPSAQRQALLQQRRGPALRPGGFDMTPTWKHAAWAALAALGLSAGLAFSQGGKPPAATSAATPATKPANAANLAKATFAGGCFWCVEYDFDKVAGVVSTTSGYIGGTVANPTYQQVSAKATGHAEAVEIVYDTTKVSYEQLLNVYWMSIDPTTKDRQFCDAGSPYRTAIFTHGPAQQAAALASRTALDKSKPFKEPIVTTIEPAGAFYAAEEYHQDYYLKNPVRYKYYRNSCGRDARLQQLWGKAP